MTGRIENRRVPQRFSDTVEQLDASGTSAVEVSTDGSEYVDLGDWKSWSEGRRDEHDVWMRDLHEAYVLLAWEPVMVRERAARLWNEHPEADGDALRACIAAARQSS